MYLPLALIGVGIREQTGHWVTYYFSEDSQEGTCFRHSRVDAVALILLTRKKSNRTRILVESHIEIYTILSENKLRDRALTIHRTNH
jgi:hypothetical protein